MIQKHADTGLPPLDEDMARAECLSQGAEAPDLAKVKDFLRFYIATSTPQTGDLPTVESMVSVAEWFFPAFTHATGTPSNEDDRTEIYSWIRRVLPAEGVIVNVRRPKYNLLSPI